MVDWSTIIVAGLALIGTLAGSYFSNSKTTALIGYRLAELEKKVEKHNSVVERVYHLEEEQAVVKEQIKVANNRIKDLESDAK